MVSGMGFLSQAPLDLHFGLGSADRAVRVTVKWPSGTTQQVDGLTTRKLHTITEPK